MSDEGLAASNSSKAENDSFFALEVVQGDPFGLALHFVAFGFIVPVSVYPILFGRLRIW